MNPPKHDENFEGLRLATAQGEQQYIKANTKVFAVALQGGGGPVGILDLKKPGRLQPSIPVLAGHSAAVMDFEFNPFHEHIIATGSEDTTVKVWGIPEAGLTETITEPLVDMHGHGKKVTLLRAHPAVLHARHPHRIYYNYTIDTTASFASRLADCTSRGAARGRVGLQIFSAV